METRSATRKLFFESEVLATTEPPVAQIKAVPLPVGTVVRTQPAHVGYKTKLWKIVKDNGVEISREEINKSAYMASNEVYEIGIVSAHPEAVAAINAAILSKDVDAIKAAAEYYSDAAYAARLLLPPLDPTLP